MNVNYFPSKVGNCLKMLSSNQVAISIFYLQLTYRRLVLNKHERAGRGGERVIVQNYAPREIVLLEFASRVLSTSRLPVSRGAQRRWSVAVDVVRAHNTFWLNSCFCLCACVSV